MVPLHRRAAVCKPDVNPKSYRSTMVPFIENRGNNTDSVLGENLRKVLRGFVRVKQSTGSRIIFGSASSLFTCSTSRPPLQSLNPALQSISLQ